MIQIENTWVQKKVVPNLNIQILYMDGPYLPVGMDHELVEIENEKSSSGESVKELNYTPSPYIINRDGIIEIGCLDPNATIYCFFDYSIRGIRYNKSQEFTDLFNTASQVLSYAIGPKGVSKTVKLK